MPREGAGHAVERVRDRPSRRGRPSRGRGRRRSRAPGTARRLVRTQRPSSRSTAVDPSVRRSSSRPGGDPVVEDEPADDAPSGRSSRGRPVVRARLLDVEVDVERVASRRRSATRSPRSGGRRRRDHPALDEQRVAGAGAAAAGRPRPSPPRPRSCPSRGAGGSRRRPAPGGASRVARSAVMTAGAQRGEQDRRFDRDRLGRRRAGGGGPRRSAASARARARSASAAVDGRMTRASTRDDGRQPAPAHLVGERHQPVRPAMGAGRVGDEAAAARLARDEPLVGQPLHRVAGGHPADPELGLELGVGRQPLARLAAWRSARGGPARSGGAGAGRPARSCRRDEARRLAPRRGRPRRSPRPRSRARPSRASTGSSEVVRTRRRSSARIGSRRRSPAAAMPPPITTRSGESTTIMLAIPMPRYVPIRSKPASAAASPSRAAWTAASAVAVPHAAASWSARANASRQPWLPQLHGGPSGSIVWWPISPAVPVVALEDLAVDRDDARRPRCRGSARSSTAPRDRHRAAAPPARTPARR